MIKHSFFLTEKQQDDLLAQAKDLGVDNIPDFLDKAIQLSKIYAAALKENCEVVIIDKDVKVLENKKEKKLALVGPKKSVMFVTDKLKEALQIETAIRATNNFGLPIDEWNA